MAKKDTIEEQLEKFKLYSNYNSSETLTENLQQISEQTTTQPAQQPQQTKDPSIDEIIRDLKRATMGPIGTGAGTNVKDIISALNKIKSGSQFNQVSAEMGKNPQLVGGYKSIIQLMRGELEGDEVREIEQIKNILASKGITDFIYTTKPNSSFFEPKSIGFIDRSKTNVANQPAQNQTPQDNKVVTPSTSNNAKTVAQVTIPQELKDVEGVKKFQTWLDANKPGWHKKYNILGDDVAKGWGKFGPNTQSAWKNEEIKNAYLNQGGVQNPTTQPVQQVTNNRGEKPNLTTPQNVPTNLKGVSTQPNITPEQYYNQLVSGGFIDSIAQGGNRIVYRGPKIDDNVENYVNQYLNTQGYTKVRERDPQNRDKEITVWKK